MDEKTLLSEFATGLAIIIVSAHVFWTWIGFSGFMTAIIIGTVGFLLTSSRFLIIWHTGTRRNPLFWMLLVIFISVLITVLPVWCHETNIMGKEFKYCVYENLWDHFIIER